MKKTKNSLVLVSEIKKQLLQIYPDAALRQQYAWWTLQAITGRTQADLIAHPDNTLTEEQENKLFHWMDALVNAHMPIQYLIGSVPFIDLNILVKEPVLIPRPETEEWVANLIQQYQLLHDQPLHILDLCTGSGCIALALAKSFPNASILATDISPHALALSEQNRVHNAINNVTFLLSDLFKEIPVAPRFDLIVSNPPYIAPTEWKTLDRSVTAWEDKQALVAEHEGLELIAKIITQAPNYLTNNPALLSQHLPNVVIEIGHTQGPAVKNLMEKAKYTDILVHRDLEQKDRVVSGRAPHVATATPE